MSTPAPAPTAAVLSGVVVVLLLDFAVRHRSWGWLRLAQGSAAFKGVPGLQFSKIMGSGHGGGFGLRPSPSHQGLVCVFDDQRNAQAFCAGAEVAAFVSRAREHWLGTLALTSARGMWDQQGWAATPEARLNAPDALLRNGSEASNLHTIPNMPIAALTRGSIRPAKAMAFWRYAPPAQADLGQAAGCQLAMGLGEAPLVRQCTFSLWDSTEALVDYAHQGAHKLAIAAAARHGFFSESLFARMRVLTMSGTWCGHHYGDAPASQSAPLPLAARLAEAAHA